jgi:hypothetical protein
MSKFNSFKPGDMIRHKNINAWLWVKFNTLEDAKYSIGEFIINNDLLANVMHVIDVDEIWAYLRMIYDGKIIYTRIHITTTWSDFEYA